MNFEFKAFDLSTAAQEKCEAMVLLFGGDFRPGKDAVSALLSVALKAGAAGLVMKILHLMVMKLLISSLNQNMTTKRDVYLAGLFFYKLAALSFSVLGLDFCCWISLCKASKSVTFRLFS